MAGPSDLKGGEGRTGCGEKRLSCKAISWSGLPLKHSVSETMQNFRDSPKEAIGKVTLRFGGMGNEPFSSD